MDVWSWKIIIKSVSPSHERMPQQKAPIRNNQRQCGGQWEEEMDWLVGGSVVGLLRRGISRGTKDCGTDLWRY